MTPLFFSLMFSISVSHVSGDFQIDHQFEGGNIIVDQIEGTRIHLRPDLRDTNRKWFYWNFKVKNAGGQKLSFQFPRKGLISSQGVAASSNEGKTWKWISKEKEPETSFSYSFKPDENDVQFCISIPYTQTDLSAFLKKHGDNKSLQVKTLCQSKKNRPVLRLHVGNLNNEPEFKVFITARHHACEMIASYALEGMIHEILSNSPDGKWLREHVEFLVIPIMDHDGVMDGDQGKNRTPRDHNRDYIDESVHPEVAALRKLVPRWSQGKLKFFLDMHCPGLAGGKYNEIIYLVENETTVENNTMKFAKLLEKTHTEGLPYVAAETLRWGEGWNNAKNYQDGLNSAAWAGRQPGVRFASTIEIPYANVKGTAMTRELARELGKNIAKSIKAFLQEY